MRDLGPHLIFLGPTGASQLGWIRAVSRELRRGRVVLLFPAGRLEPDPAILGTEGALLPWSASVDVIRRFAPEAQIVPAAVTGVLSPRAFSHPLTRIRRTARDRQRVATLLQMISPHHRAVGARIAFGAPLAADLDDTVSALLAARMRELISGPPLEWLPLPPPAQDSPKTTAA
jgi:hypothetical protein